MITLQFRQGYWTVCVDDQALMSFASYERAVAMAPEAVHRAVAA